MSLFSGFLITNDVSLKEKTDILQNCYISVFCKIEYSSFAQR